MSMARTIRDWEVNKNAVIFWYLGHPPYEDKKPYGCVVKFHGYSISATIWDKGFRVFSNAENFSKPFQTLREAKQFVIDRVNKKRRLF